MIDFWASWCLPCRKEHPAFKKVYETYKTKNFEILSVSIDEDRNAWESASKRTTYTGQVFLDTKGQSNEVVAKYTVQVIPANFLVNRNGVIIAKNLKGEKSGKTLEDLLK